jgi:AI-2 transport protein TqsA
MRDGETIRNRLLAVIAFVLVVAALRASFPVTMPLAVAAVIIAAVWPLKPMLDRVLPWGISYLGTVLVLLAIAAAFMAGIYFSLSQVVRTFLDQRERFRSIYEAVSSWMTQWGLPDIGGGSGFQQLVGIGQALLGNLYTVLVYVGFIAILVVLGLPEVPSLHAKTREELDRAERRELVETVHEIAAKIRRYIGVTTLTSMITGLACFLWPLAVGLDLAAAWGFLNFLLNYIPVLGNIVGIFPPSLYALIQFEGWTMPLVVFLGFAAVQIAISNFLYPMMQGRSLSLSPVAIVMALTFWGWVWGIAGALIAIPLTVALVIACEHFPSTEWIATALSGRRGKPGDEPRERGGEGG